MLLGSWHSGANCWEQQRKIAGTVVVLRAFVRRFAAAAGNERTASGPPAPYMHKAKVAKLLISDDVQLLSKVAHAPPALLKNLVLHRGWHASNDCLSRPLENTLAAYERAWSLAGAHYAECDVTLTTDDEIVLHHDDTLARLALLPELQLSTTALTQLSSQQTYSVALKDGSHVPCLRAVLAAASRIGGPAKLVVEIKGDNVRCAHKLAEFCHARSELAQRIAVVMGFSADAVHAFAEAFPRRADGGMVVMLLTELAERRMRGDEPTLDLSDTSALEALLQRPGSRIDGLYVEYDPDFAANPKFPALCSRLPIGVWGRAGLDPDTRDSAMALIAKGARFVNTDLPADFMRVAEP
jgi:glycerophosphoryl diester phosphodiesterase